MYIKDENNDEDILDIHNKYINIKTKYDILINDISNIYKLIDKYAE